MSGRPASRAAVLFASAATALACSSSGLDSGTGGTAPPYDAGAQEDAGFDAVEGGSIVLLYGSAPVDDAGPDADARAKVDASDGEAPDAEATDAEAQDSSTTYDAGNVPVVYGPPPIGG